MIFVHASILDYYYCECGYLRTCLVHEDIASGPKLVDSIHDASYVFAVSCWALLGATLTLCLIDNLVRINGYVNPVGCSFPHLCPHRTRYANTVVGFCPSHISDIPVSDAELFVLIKKLNDYSTSNHMNTKT